MQQVNNEEAHIIITSPPYGSVKNYGNPNQIGFNDSVSSYLNKLDNVWSECLRILKPGCRLCINIGDQYVRATKKTPYQILPLHAFMISRIMEKHRNLLYLGSIIWQKISNTKTTGGASVMGSYGYPRNGYVSYNFEYIAIFKKNGASPKLSVEQKQQSNIKSEWRNLFNGIWRIHGAPQNNGIAVFPDAIPERLIKMFTAPGDTVLDPFLGSGTTTKKAYEMGRNSVGYEIGYCDLEENKRIIKKKLCYEKLPLEERQRAFPTL
ncbi:MAG: site-specific DNA-methyltransferase [Candidatus Bathyarchaeia archaeon]|jgi:site-specific DNA-methyltransferase (adenine-specific)